MFTFFWQSAAKTPVSLLQELYVKKGINPKYDLIQIEGAIHEPTFKYRVSVGDVVGKNKIIIIFKFLKALSNCILSHFIIAMGSGQSKKKAKHSAAKAILDKIWGSRCQAFIDNEGACM